MLYFIFISCCEVNSVLRLVSYLSAIGVVDVRLRPALLAIFVDFLFSIFVVTVIELIFGTLAKSLSVIFFVLDSTIIWNRVARVIVGIIPFLRELINHLAGLWVDALDAFTAIAQAVSAEV